MISDIGIMNSVISNYDAVRHTMLMIVAARAVSHKKAPDTGFSDSWAVGVVSSLPWDLTRYQQDLCFVRHVALRAKLMDTIIAGFFEKNPDSSGAGLGCGLCARGRRIKAIFKKNLKDTSFRWIDIDLPEVVRLRERYFPPLPDEILMEGSVSDTAWLDTMPATRSPMILVMEGVSPYLSLEENRSLFRNLGARLEGTGSEMVFDFIHPSLADSMYITNTAGGTQTPFRSGFCCAEDVMGLHPSIRIVSEHSTFSKISKRHLLFEMEFNAASLGQKPYTILHIRFDSHE
jgi:O-methyltransferase involved in polyketide biosynthesis